jgi:hypothetical protein
MFLEQAVTITRYAYMYIYKEHIRIESDDTYGYIRVVGEAIL